MGSAEKVGLLNQPGGAAGWSVPKTNLFFIFFLTADHGLILGTHLQIGQGSIAKPPHLEQVEETRTGS